jgi:Mn2+/Fe2+ NRAMP family transporter
MMPLVTLAILVLINSRKLMGKHKAGLWLNLGIVATLGFSIFAAVMGVRGLLGI